MTKLKPPSADSGLDPAQESYLAELLGRCTEMPVTLIEDNTAVR